jgi:hypothetical protein
LDVAKKRIPWVSASLFKLVLSYDDVVVEQVGEYSAKTFNSGAMHGEISSRIGD